MTAQIVYCDARELPNRAPDIIGRVRCIATSPPYWGRRVYGASPDEIGVGDLDRYIAELVDVFDGLIPLLTDDATVWVNIGDTAAGSGGAGGDHNAGGSKSNMPKYRQGKPVLPDGRRLPPRNWCMVPYRFADAMIDAGWVLRSVIVWDKGHPRPESAAHTKRPGEQSERVLMFTRTPNRYFFDADGLVEPGDVWHFAPGADRKHGHYAPFPDEMARRMILPSTAPGDIVLDPFAGSGTTLRVAAALDRLAVGCELYEPETIAP